jgi:molybdate transport system ATP-binding protein
MSDFVLKASSLSIHQFGKQLITNLSFTMNTNDQWAITGHSGSGKTTLLETIAGKHFFHGQLTADSGEDNFKVVLVEQQHHFRNLSNTVNFYYQQRFNSSDAEDAITVMEDLKSHVGDNAKGEEDISSMVRLFRLEHVLNERLIMLSNGENKRLQIAKALLDSPSLLLLDNPFIGLDTEARQILESVLQQVVEQGMHVVLVTSLQQLPPFITHVIHLRENGTHNIMKAAEARSMVKPVHTGGRLNIALLDELLQLHVDEQFDVAVKMINVNIIYDDRKIVDNVNWFIRRGEQWSLSGPNGAGKSTLLSLVNADNPQAYANEIYLFDRRRGSGETIWDIKRKIGFISPELHLHFDQTNTGFEVVASGLFDTIGLFRQVNEEQRTLIYRWMELLQVDHLGEKMMHRLSNSEQRMILLARALVKNPPVLILDEPCQGLDEEQVASFRQLINEVCTRGNKTLVYVSHYVHEIPECVNRFARIENGRLTVN